MFLSPLITIYITFLFWVNIKSDESAFVLCCLVLFYLESLIKLFYNFSIINLSESFLFLKI